MVLKIVSSNKLNSTPAGTQNSKYEQTTHHKRNDCAFVCLYMTYTARLALNHQTTCQLKPIADRCN